MIKLAEIFQDGMVIQRDQKWRIWGDSTDDEALQVSINGTVIVCENIKKGSFQMMLPPQGASENMTLEIGGIRIEHVDFGEVWIAGGQSNMEFLMKYDRELEQVLNMPEDSHMRYFEVPKYCFEEEKEDGFKDDSKWNRWLTFCPENTADFSAVGTYFALELRRRYQVPVAVISCNWGGTSALAWMDKKTIQEDAELNHFLQMYEEETAKLDMDQYLAANYAARQSMSSPIAKASNDFMLKNTATLEDVLNYSKELLQKAGISVEQQEMSGGASVEAFMMTGPRDANRPAALYDMMLTRIAGYTARGVIWYQGENDVDKAALYLKLFWAVAASWRKAWQSELPFLYVQLAPFESWMQCEGSLFPEIRRQQEMAEKQIEKVYMISSSDCGNQFDIHPKEKRPIGHRLALAAAKYVYGEQLLADAPRVERGVLEKDRIVISFMYGDGLVFEGSQPDALEVYVDGNVLVQPECSTDDRCLILTSKVFETAKEVRVSFAQRPYYRVNLYNEAGIPAIPFELKCVHEKV